ncbi:MAG TPA: ABC transporter substrate-binding protein [Thermomicrobiales bacterium]|nr:ABC transporter substrate-binding protein [Thermomicrobiales bacterium]
MRTLNRREAMQGMAGALTALAVPGRTPVIAATARESAALVRFAWWSDVGVPTPFQVSAVGPGGAVLLSLIYDTLTWKDEDGIIPWLASEWGVSDDGLGYSFHLIEGAAWHDGEPVTAADVAFSFDAYTRHPYRWMSTEVIDSVEVAAEHVVAFQLKRPYAAFIEDIAGVVPIVPRHIWESVDDPIAYSGADRSVGSGPFKLADYDESQGAYRLVANEAYWRGRTVVQEWQQFTVPPEARVQVLQQGEVDITLSTDASVRELFGGDDRLQVFETAPLSIVRLAINTRRPPLDQHAVRQAIAYALDRQLIAETITRGPAIPGSAGVIPPETPWYNPSLQQYAYNADRARELLGGKRYTLDLIADPSAREPELMAPMLEEVGITLNVQQVDAATRLQLLADGDFQLALTSHIGVGGDPDYLRRWYSGEETNAFAQGSIFDNEEFARLGEEQAAALDPEERRELIFRMQEILAEELPTIVLYHRRFYWAYDSAVFTPMETWGGLMNGIPFPNNKLTLIDS